MTPARGPAVTFDLAAAADWGQRSLGPSAAGAPRGNGQTLLPENRSLPPPPARTPSPTLQQVNLSPFAPLPQRATWWEWGLKSLLDSWEEGRGTRGDKVGSSVPRMDNLARLSFPAFFQVGLGPEAGSEGHKPQHSPEVSVGQEDRVEARPLTGTELRPVLPYPARDSSPAYTCTREAW